MYTIEELSHFPFFHQALNTAPLTSLHDSLTGLIVRPVILQFIQSLLQDRMSFTLSIVDLDNFKNINDNYGHQVGDEMLRLIGGNLRRIVGHRGVVGRFGGDEFLIVTPDDNDYNRKHAFLESLYGKSGTFRRDLLIGGRTIFTTATIGCASFPGDAESFETLFSLADKALYRGKSKGRNCFIIYVPEKHAKLDIPTLAGRNLYDSFRAMAGGFDSGRDDMERLRLAFAPVRENLRLHRLFYADADRRLYDVESGAFLEYTERPERLVSEGILPSRGLDELERDCPTLTERLRAMGYESVLLIAVAGAGQRGGFLVFCPEAHTQHIWQENECAAAFFLSRMLAQHLAGKAAGADNLS